MLSIQWLVYSNGRAERVQRRVSNKPIAHVLNGAWIPAYAGTLWGGVVGLSMVSSRIGRRGFLQGRSGRRFVDLPQRQTQH